MGTPKKLPEAVEDAFDFFDKVLAIAMPNKADRMKTLFEDVRIKNGEIVDPFRKPKDTASEWKELEDLRGQISEYLISTHTSGEIAITASHRKALLAFLSDPDAQTALIFEDDAQVAGPDIHGRLHRSLQTLEEKGGAWDMLMLGRCWDSCDPSDTVDSRSDLRISKYAKCFQAYGVSRIGAEKILQFFKTCDENPAFPCGCAADCAPSRIQSPHNFAISPALFVQSRRVLQQSASATLYSAYDAARNITPMMGNQHRVIFSPECQTMTRAMADPSLSYRQFKSFGSNVVYGWPLFSHPQIDNLNRMIWHVHDGIKSDLEVCRGLNNTPPFVDGSYDWNSLGMRHSACATEVLLRDQVRDRRPKCMQTSSAFFSTQYQCWLSQVGYFGFNDQQGHYNVQNSHGCCKMARFLLYDKKSLTAARSVRVFEDPGWLKPPWCKLFPPKAMMRIDPPELRIQKRGTLTKIWNKRLQVEHRIVLKAGSTSIRDFLTCLWEDDAEFVKQSTLTPNGWLVTSAVREPIDRFISAVGEVLQRGINRICPEDPVCGVQNGYTADTIPRLKQGTSWFLKSLFLKTDGLNPNDPEHEDNLTLMLEKLVHDVTCGHKFYASEHFFTQTSLLMQGTDVLKDPFQAHKRLRLVDIKQFNHINLRQLRNMQWIGSDYNNFTHIALCKRKAFTNDASMKNGKYQLPKSQTLLNILHKNVHLIKALCMVYIQDYINFGYMFKKNPDTGGQCDLLVDTILQDMIRPASSSVSKYA